MNIEIIETNFLQEKTEDFLTQEAFKKFQETLFTLASENCFDDNEKGRKDARSLARKVGTLKTKITEKFDDLIKAENAKNKAALDRMELIKSNKKKYLEECVATQGMIKKHVDIFDALFKEKTAEMAAMKKTYQSVSEIKKAKQDLLGLYDYDFQEKRKDAEKIFSEIFDYITSQELLISQLEDEKKKNAQQPVESVPEAQPTAPQEEVKAPKETYTMFFDTETTSVISSQARIVQIAAMVFDSKQNLVEKMDVLIQQEEPIPEETIKIHGKTNEMCEKEGIPLIDALFQLKDLVDNSDVVVCHNKNYDMKVVEAEFKRISHTFVCNAKTFDTMSIYRDIVQCPPTEKMIKAGFNNYKNPTLVEAYKFVFGKEFESAHDAFADVKATADIYHNFVRVNRAVIATLKENGVPEDMARVLARKLSQNDLTKYTVIRG